MVWPRPVFVCGGSPPPSPSVRARFCCLLRASTSQHARRAHVLHMSGKVVPVFRCRLTHVQEATGRPEREEAEAAAGNSSGNFTGKLTEHNTPSVPCDVND